MIMPVRLMKCIWHSAVWPLLLILVPLIVSCQGATAAEPALATSLNPSGTITQLATQPPADTPTTTPTQFPTPTSTTTPTATSTPLPPEVIGPNSYPENVNPLTGLVVDDVAVLNRRPLVIKISNAPPEVRPQSGIGSADMIFEHYAEGGWTRFSAIFYSHSVQHVGSVRSVRLIDLQLTPAYDAILVFSGGSLGVIDTLRLAPIYPKNVISPQFGYGEPYFVRFPREGLPFEHTLFTNTDTLWSLVDQWQINRRPSLSPPGLVFSAFPPDGGAPASVARLEYARTSVLWRYDAATGQYLRWTDGIPHTDALTGEQLDFENVIFMSAYHELQVLFPEKYFGEEESLYIELHGEGPATLLRDGQAFEGRWVREGDEDQFTFYNSAGSPLRLKPGQTFFQIIRLGFEQVTIEP